ncbi:MAG: hypothetical protein JST52_06030 [Bacteroidetes bacterium]|nr:hypothetical protein [Bacteroidota bacterium]MBS1739415.1 hypothetical protein [Bacteroidota bacterium]
MKSKLLVASGILILASCVRVENRSLQSYLVGNWQLKSMGSDLNGNGSLDSNEVQMTIPDSMGLFTTFQADGKGVANIKINKFNLSSDFRWKVDEATKMVTIVSDSTQLLSALCTTQGAYDMTFALQNGSSSPIGKTLLTYHRK